MTEKAKKVQKEFRCPKCKASTVVSSDGKVQCVACEWSKKKRK